MILGSSPEVIKKIQEAAKINMLSSAVTEYQRKMDFSAGKQSGKDDIIKEYFRCFEDLIIDNDDGDVRTQIQAIGEV